MIRKVFPAYFIILLFIGVNTRAFCQDSSSRHQNLFNLGLGLNAGVAKFFNTSVSHSFQQQNLPTAFTSAPLSLGLNIFYDPVHPDAKITYHISLGIASQKSSQNNVSLNANAFWNDYTLDYVLFKKGGRQYFFPGIGFGWMNYHYNLVGTNNYPASYPAALQNFTDERSLQSGMLTYINLEANYGYTLNKAGNFLLGVSAAYHAGLNSKTMQLGNGYALSQSPSVNANCFIGSLFLIIQ